MSLSQSVVSDATRATSRSVAKATVRIGDRWSLGPGPRARPASYGEPMDHYLFDAPAKDRDGRLRQLADAAHGRSGEAVVCVD